MTKLSVDDVYGPVDPILARRDAEKLPDGHPYKKLPVLDEDEDMRLYKEARRANRRVRKNP